MASGIFDSFPNILTAVSEVKDGGMRIDYSLKKDTLTLTNRQNFLKKFGLTNQDIVTARLIHGNRVKAVSQKEKGAIISDVDALITDERGVYLAITTADCLPVFIYDPAQKTIGLVHAGWRGLEKKIIPKTISKMHKEYGSDPENLLVKIGQGIGVCHFEVGEEVVKKFEDYPIQIIKKDKGIFIDLKQVALEQLLKNGVRKDCVKINPDCTYESNKYFSFRRGKDSPTKTNLSVIGLR